MNTSSSSSSSLDFPKQVVNMMIDSFEKANMQAVHMLWNALMIFLSQHWVFVFLVLFAILIFTTLKAMLGRWGSLGSVLYNFLYFGTLFIVGLIWGPELFISDIFNATCTIILYPVCYTIVGIILDKTNLRSRKAF